MSLSHLVQTLGLTVLHMLWIGTLIGGVAFVWLRSNQDADPRARYACAVGGLMALLVGTGLTFAFLASMSPTPIVFPVDAAGPSTTDDLQLSVETASLQRNFDRGTTGLGRATTSMIAWGWITGIALMSVRLFRQWIRVRRLRVVGIAEPSADWALMFNTLKSKIGIDSRISMLVSHTIDSPMVVGWLRPLVLVPAAAFTSLTPDQLQTVLAHELQHIARRDHLVNMLQAFIEVLLFFHPVTWWLSRQIRVERENCCDDGALLVTGAPRTFAEALLVLESLRTNKNHSPQLLTATGGSLMHRVSRLFGTNQPQPLNAGWRTLSACTLLAAAGLAFTTAAIDPAAVAQDRRGTNAQTADLDELKAQIEARTKAIGEDLWRQVAAGEISEADAKARFEEGERRMWMRYRDAEAKTVGGGNSKADYETAVEKMTEMVKAGKITREQMQQRLDRMKQAGQKKADGGRKMSKADYDKAVEKMTEMVATGEITRDQMQQRLDRMKQAGMKKTEDIDLKALKARIEERVLAMGVDLRKQVAAGKISEADAKARFEEGEKKMWMRYRAAEEKAAAAKNDGIDLDELKARIEERVRAMGMNLRKQVAAGEISESDAKARFEEGEKKMWMRYRAAEEKSAAGGKSKADYDAAVKKMTEMVESGKITREQMQQRLERMKHADD
jgi:beta-lactamase regulating signal transducer with metallopeptidase domain